MCCTRSDSGEKTRRLYLYKFISSKEYLAALWSTVKLTTDQCWSYKGVHLGVVKTLVTLIDLVSLFLQREKLHMLISSCSAVQAADGCTRAETAVLTSQESAVFHLVLPGFT
jgi:hypothetical protein